MLVASEKKEKGFYRDACKKADDALLDYLSLRSDFITARDYNRFRREDDNRSDEELEDARWRLTSVYWDLKVARRKALALARACSAEGGNASPSDVPRLPAFPEKEY